MSMFEPQRNRYFFTSNCSSLKTGPYFILYNVNKLCDKPVDQGDTVI